MKTHNNDINATNYSMTTMSTRNHLSQRQRQRRRRAFGLLFLVTFIATAATTSSTVNAGSIPTSSSCFVAAATSGPRSSRRSSASLTFSASISLQRSSTARASSTTTTLDIPTTSNQFVATEEDTRKRRTTSTTTPTNNWKSRLGLARSSPFLLNKKERDELDYQQRKHEWASRYCNVKALRQTFGSNRNKLWGDLDAKTARRLYKTLLPRALLELYHLGVKPEDLAPLAFQARVAAKLYARERCEVPGRMAANLIDGFRQWKRYGKFQPKGMSYTQIWRKYEIQVLEDLREMELQEEDEDEHDLCDEDVTARICLKILERSCQTNEHIDRWILRDSSTKLEQQEEEDLVAINEQLERDVFNLLNASTTTTKKEKSLRARKIFMLKMVVRARRRLEALKKTNNNNVTTTTAVIGGVPQDHHDVNGVIQPPARDQQEDDDESSSSTPTQGPAARPWNERTSKINSRKKSWQERSTTSSSSSSSRTK